MKFEKKYNVEITDIGMNNKITNLALLRFLEQIGCAHSSLWGYGVNNIPTTKRAWILMDWKLKVLNRPIYGDEILIKTWPRPLEKHFLYTYRDFEIYKGEEKVAIATSKWVMCDTQNNKICKIPDDIVDKYNPEDCQVFEEKDIPKLKEVQGSKLALEYEVKRADIDVNKHMHNLNYLNLAYEALPEEVYFSEDKKMVRIMYKNQILLGEKVLCYYTRQKEKDIITIKNRENTKVHAIIELS